MNEIIIFCTVFGGLCILIVIVYSVYYLTNTIIEIIRDRYRKRQGKILEKIANIERLEREGRSNPNNSIILKKSEEEINKTFIGSITLDRDIIYEIGRDNPRSYINNNNYNILDEDRITFTGEE